jgi:hypothetical protein
VEAGPVRVCRTRAAGLQRLCNDPHEDSQHHAQHRAIGGCPASVRPGSWPVRRRAPRSRTEPDARRPCCGVWPSRDDAVAVLRPHQDRARRQVQKAAHCRRHRDLPLRGEFGLDFLHHGMLADYRGNGLGRAGLAEGAAPLDSSACQGPLLTFRKAPEATDPAARSPGSPGMAHFSVRRPVTDAGRTPC